MSTEIKLISLVRSAVCFVLLLTLSGAGYGFDPKQKQLSSVPFTDVGTFGAVGDGVTDDTAALQAAANSGLNLSLQRGKNYLISGGMTFHTTTGARVFGNGSTISVAPQFVGVTPTPISIGTATTSLSLTTTKGLVVGSQVSVVAPTTLNKVFVKNRGFGYSPQTTWTYTSPEGSVASGTVNVDSYGSITGAITKIPGSGFLTAGGIVQLQNVGSGVGAVLIAQLVDNLDTNIHNVLSVSANSITVDTPFTMAFPNGGTVFGTCNPFSFVYGATDCLISDLTIDGQTGMGGQATATVSNGSVTGIALSTFGSYTTPPSVLLVGGGGSGATATATVVTGVTRVIIENGGVNYTNATITFDGPNPATAVPIIRGGRIVGATVTNPGNIPPGGLVPNVTISGDGTGASAICTIGSTLSGISVTNGGTNYTSPPSVFLRSNALISRWWTNAAIHCNGSRNVFRNLLIRNFPGEGVLNYNFANSVEDCVFENLWGNGNHFTLAQNPRLIHSSFINCNQEQTVGHVDGAVVWSDLINHALVDGCYIWGGLSAFSGIDQPDNQDALVTNCTAINTTGYCVYAFSPISDLVPNDVPRNISFRNNRFYNCGPAFLGYLSPAVSPLVNCNFTGNLFDGTDFLINGLTHSAISDNTFLDSNTYVQGLANCTVTNNRILRGTHQLVGWIDSIFSNNSFTSTSPQFQNLTSVSVRGNIFKLLGTNADSSVLFYNANKCAIDGNFWDDNIDPSLTTIVVLMSSCSGTEFSSNRIVGGGTSLSTSGPSTNLVITRNNLSGFNSSGVYFRASSTTQGNVIADNYLAADATANSTSALGLRIAGSMVSVLRNTFDMVTGYAAVRIGSPAVGVNVTDGNYVLSHAQVGVPPLTNSIVYDRGTSGGVAFNNIFGTGIAAPTDFGGGNSLADPRIITYQVLPTSTIQVFNSNGGNIGLISQTGGAYVRVTGTLGGTLSLPKEGLQTGMVFIIKDGGGSASLSSLIVSGSGNLIDGKQTKILGDNYGVVRVRWSGTVWETW